MEPKYSELQETFASFVTILLLHKGESTTEEILANSFKLNTNNLTVPAKLKVVFTALKTNFEIIKNPLNVVFSYEEIHKIILKAIKSSESNLESTVNDLIRLMKSKNSNISFSQEHRYKALVFINCIRNLFFAIRFSDFITIKN